MGGKCNGKAGLEICVLLASLLTYGWPRLAYSNSQLPPWKATTSAGLARFDNAGNEQPYEMAEIFQAVVSSSSLVTSFEHDSNFISPDLIVSLVPRQTPLAVETGKTPAFAPDKNVLFRRKDLAPASPVFSAKQTNDQPSLRKKSQSVTVPKRAAESSDAGRSNEAAAAAGEADIGLGAQPANGEADRSEEQFLLLRLSDVLEAWPGSAPARSATSSAAPLYEEALENGAQSFSLSRALLINTAFNSREGAIIANGNGTAETRQALPKVPITSPQMSVVANGAAVSPANGKRYSLLLPPIRTWGYLGYEIRRETFGETEYLSQALNAEVNADTHTYVWKPWFAKVKAGVGVSAVQNNSSSESNSTQTEYESTSTFLTGKLSLDVLPYSRFPFEAHFDRSNNWLETGLSGIDSSYRSTRYGFSQRYSTEKRDTTLGANYDHNTWDGASYGKGTQETINLQATKQLNKNSFQVDASSTRSEREQTKESTDLEKLIFRHNYVPDLTLSVETLADRSHTNYNLTQSKSDLKFLQLSSTAFWRPKDKPMTVTAGARVFDNSTSFAGTSSDFRSATLYGGVVYDLTKQLRLNGNANVNVSDNIEGRTITSLQSLGISYQSVPFDWRAFSIHRNASATVSNRVEPDESGQHLNLQLGHSLNRSMPFQQGSLAINLGQTISTDFDTIEPTILRLIHNGSVTWGRVEDVNNTYFRLTASDSRALTGVDDFFQLLNLQASRSRSLSRNEALQGNLTIQATRQRTATVDPITGSFTTSLPSAPVTLTTISSADLSYSNFRAFNIPRLGFVSELRIYGNKPVPLIGDPNEQETHSWENRFTYSIGRTQLRLTARIAEVVRSGNTDTQSSLMFSLLRPFGDF